MNEMMTDFKVEMMSEYRLDDKEDMDVGMETCALSDDVLPR